MWSIARNALMIALGALSACAISYSLAQQPGSGAQAPTPAGVSGANGGHITITGGGTPTGSGVTVDPFSTDNFGTITATATSGSITFAAPYVRAPICSLDNTAATQPTWVATTTGITLTTIVVGNVYNWLCFARPGG